MTNQPPDPDSRTGRPSPDGSGASSPTPDNRDLAKLALPPTVGVLLAMTRDLNDTTPRVHMKPRRRSMPFTLAVIAGLLIAAVMLVVAARRGRPARRGPAPVASTAARPSGPAVARAANAGTPMATPGRLLASAGGVTVTEITAPGSTSLSEGTVDATMELVTPPYPEAARRLGVSGTVEIETTIDATGRVVVTTPISGQAIFRESVETALLHSRFPPPPGESPRALTRRRFRVVFTIGDTNGEAAARR